MNEPDKMKTYELSTYEYRVKLTLNITKLAPHVRDMILFWSGGKKLLQSCDGDDMLAFAKMAAALGLKTCVENQASDYSLKYLLDGPLAPVEGWIAPLSDYITFLDVDYEELPSAEDFN